MPEVVVDILREGSINQLSDERKVDGELIGVESGHPDILASEPSRNHRILTDHATGVRQFVCDTEPRVKPSRWTGFTVMGTPA